MAQRWRDNHTAIVLHIKRKLFDSPDAYISWDVSALLFYQQGRPGIPAGTGMKGYKVNLICVYIHLLRGYHIG